MSSNDVEVATRSKRQLIEMMAVDIRHQQVFLVEGVYLKDQSVEIAFSNTQEKHRWTGRNIEEAIPTEVYMLYHDGQSYCYRRARSEKASRTGITKTVISSLNKHHVCGRLDAYVSASCKHNESTLCEYVEKMTLGHGEVRKIWKVQEFKVETQPHITAEELMIEARRVAIKLGLRETEKRSNTVHSMFEELHKGKEEPKMENNEIVFDLDELAEAIMLKDKLSSIEAYDEAKAIIKAQKVRHNQTQEGMKELHAKEGLFVMEHEEVMKLINAHRLVIGTYAYEVRDVITGTLIEVTNYKEKVLSKLNEGRSVLTKVHSWEDYLAETYPGLSKYDAIEEETKSSYFHAYFKQRDFQAIVQDGYIRVVSAHVI